MHARHLRRATLLTSTLNLCQAARLRCLILSLRSCRGSSCLMKTCHTSAAIVAAAAVRRVAPVAAAARAAPLDLRKGMVAPMRDIRARSLSLVTLLLGWNVAVGAGQAGVPSRIAAPWQWRPFPTVGPHMAPPVVSNGYWLSYPKNIGGDRSADLLIKSLSTERTTPVSFSLPSVRVMRIESGAVTLGGHILLAGSYHTRWVQYCRLDSRRRKQRSVLLDAPWQGRIESNSYQGRDDNRIQCCTLLEQGRRLNTF
jgi:hypothetical protein